MKITTKKTFNAVKIIFLPIIILSGNLNFPLFDKSFSLSNEEIIWQEDHVVDAPESYTYYDASQFDIIGKVPNTDTYARLPEKAREVVRQPVWSLSRSTAGLAIRFTSNTTTVRVRWTLLRNPTMANMTPIGSKGLDLYIYKNNRWQFAGVASPQDSIYNEATIINGMTGEDREYLLNLPLYDGIVSLEIGIDENATIAKPDRGIIDQNNPIIFYGTSITQGASASRPGLSYAALIERNLNKEVINLGFSGNGRFEKEVATHFMPADPALIILDCTPNSAADTIRKNLPELLEYIRSVNKTVPIMLVETIIRDYAHFKKDDPETFGTFGYLDQQNNTLHDVYEDFHKADMNLHFIDGEDLIGHDNEATIDGTHFNDLGNYRAYEILTREIRAVLKL